MTQTQSKPPAARSTEQPILRARGLHKSFKMGDSRVTVLRDAAIDIMTGEFVAIEGRSGSGKSTLLHLLGALDEAESGTIEYNGRDIEKMRGGERSELRNTQFGFVFQFYHLLPELGVLQNVMMPPMIGFFEYLRNKKRLRDHASQLLDSFGLGHRLSHRPNQLSGGERQRVAIARALMNSPRVLFADEPTGNLDAETGSQIMGVLERLHRDKGQTIVMVTHDRALARTADRVLVLRDGALAPAE